MYVLFAELADVEKKNKLRRRLKDVARRPLKAILFPLIVWEVCLGWFFFFTLPNFCPVLRVDWTVW